MESQRVYVFSPIYFDIESFCKLRLRILEILTESSFSISFVAIDDSAGIDYEFKKLEEFKDVQVITCPFNVGHQRALVYGIRKFSERLQNEDIVVTMDSDGEDLPEHLPRLLRRLNSSQNNLRKIVLARRTKRREKPLFKCMYAMFKIVFQVLTGALIRTGNYAVFRGWTAKNVLKHPHFDLSYASSLISLNLDSEFEPCERGVRYAGVSKMSYLKLIIHGLRMLMPFLDRIAVRCILFLTACTGISLATALLFLGAGIVSENKWFIVGTLALMTSVLLGIAMVVALALFSIFSQSQGLALRDLESRN